MSWHFTLASAAAALMLSLSGSPAAAQTSASPYTKATRYDAMHRVVGTIAPDPDGPDPAGPLHFAAVRNTYDGTGRLTKVEKGELGAWQSDAVAPKDWPSAATDPARFTIFQTLDTTYDGMDRKTRDTVKGTAGLIFSVTDYSYDPVGRLECTAVRMNSASWGAMTNACTAQAMTTAPDRITKNIYDAAGQLVQVREGVGTGIEVADATYSYTPNGKKEYVVDAEGNRARLIYDGFDRLYRWFFPSKVKAASFNDSTQANALASANSVSDFDYEQYDYDANGNRTWLRKRDGWPLTYQYDTLNRMTVKVVPERTGLAAIHTRDVYYDYDAQGLMTEARFDSLSGPGISNNYDGFGRLQSTTNRMGAARSLSYTYDADGNRTKVTHPDGPYFRTAADGLDRTNYAFWKTPAQGTETQFMAIQFEPFGQRRNINRASSWTGYGYNPALQLAWVGQDFPGTAQDANATIGYNPAAQVIGEDRDNDAFAWTGARTSNRDYALNGLNQYTSVGPNPYTYDPNGNLTSDALTTFTYDVENRLVAASGAKTIAMVYDPMGRLWETSGGPWGKSDFLYDGDKLAIEYDGDTGGIRKRFFFGANVDEPILEDTNGTLDCSGSRFLHHDRQGSIVALADCWGTRTNVNSYDEYGIPSSTNAGRFQYTGQMWVPELGMYYYKARIYSPTLGRFMQTDPIGYDDQINLYAYVGDDPVNKTDPSGTSPGDVYGTLFDAASAAAQEYVPQSSNEHREFGGFFYTKNGGFAYTTPWKGVKDSVDLPLGCWFKHCIEGWHTHGYPDAGYDNESFSGNAGDEGWAAAAGKPFWLFTPSGWLKRFDPKTRKHTRSKWKVLKQQTSSTSVASASGQKSSADAPLNIDSKRDICLWQGGIMCVAVGPISKGQSR